MLLIIFVLISLIPPLQTGELCFMLPYSHYNLFQYQETSPYSEFRRSIIVVIILTSELLQLFLALMITRETYYAFNCSWVYNDDCYRKQSSRQRINRPPIRDDKRDVGRDRGEEMWCRLHQAGRGSDLHCKQRGLHWELQMCQMENWWGQWMGFR